MIVSCPTCSTRYTLSDQSLGPDGRKVRCAKCGHIWWQRPEEPDFEPMMADAPTEIRPVRPPKAAAKKAKPPKAPRQPPARSTVVGFALLGVLLAGTAAGAYLARDVVVRSWPAAALFYETVGLPVEPPGTGLELRNIHSAQMMEGGAVILVLDGEVANSSDVERAVPPLRGISLGPDRKPLQSWVMEPSAATLAPGAVATFHHSQPDPGPVAEVTITFGGPPPGLPAPAPEKAAEKPTSDKPAAEKAKAEKHAAPADPHAKPAGH
ncbi:MJ0042-type zinc finger domain-containing protein [Azospirillum sp. TSO35-2]|uniref:MJ0042-type zinc finger domain-containing protein n=1 Tax=Azospirillum sp. TSO35-2 TaxID=716796 RepID=UPI000D611D97|nr:MJ0042-type zinc finger domain-containing protein [Azospirillum sp. TSO35-2]PWC33836.1 hypothetical protein TSO352_26035 [Azospirillum sp. TSO35-2]